MAEPHRAIPVAGDSAAGISKARKRDAVAGGAATRVAATDAERMAPAVDRSPALRRSIEAVLFDLDGTLIDSEPVYVDSNREFLARYGVHYDRERSESFVGRGTSEMLKDLEAMHPESPLSALPLAEKTRMIDEAYMAYAPGRVKAFPGVEALARRLRDRGVPIAIASGSSPGVIRLMVESCGFEGLFGAVVAAAEVPRGKPAPDVFLEAASRLGVDPSRCLVLEDSEFGVQAALAAGMACVALPSPGSPWRAAFERADLIVNGGAGSFEPELALAAFDWKPGIRD